MHNQNMQYEPVAEIDILRELCIMYTTASISTHLRKQARVVVAKPLPNKCKHLKWPPFCLLLVDFSDKLTKSRNHLHLSAVNT